MNFIHLILGAWTDWFSWLGVAGSIGLAIGLVVLCIAGWGLNLIALPGNWIAVALLAFYAWLGPSEGRIAMGFLIPGIAFGFAMTGEILEFAASAVGAQKAGASRRSTIFAMIGSMIGAIAGAFIGVPVPLLGPVIAALIFGGLGATAGAVYGEWSDGKAWRESWAIGHAAFWGRTFGTLGKVTAGLMIILLAVLGVLI